MIDIGPPEGHRRLFVLDQCAQWVYNIGMKRNPRRKVIRFETHPNNGPSKGLFPECATAVLECGHRLNLGVSSERPKRMACYECAAAGIDRWVITRTELLLPLRQQTSSPTGRSLAWPSQTRPLTTWTCLGTWIKPMGFDNYPIMPLGFILYHNSSK